jgi:peptide/nickel transport system ATP-binding protein
MMADVSGGASGPVLSVRDLKVHYPFGGGLLKKPDGVVKSVDGVSFAIAPGETFSLVGESGCGKTTTGRAVLRIVQPTAGEVRYSRADGSTLDVARATEAELTAYRREVRLVFQDPAASLNPRLTVRDVIAESLIVQGMAQSEIDDRVAWLMRRVGLRPEYRSRYPHAFSGGERQRISIARALAPGPRVVIADEALSALDVSVQAQTINLLLELQQDLGLTYLFISHDLSVVSHLSDRVAVMYVGRIVETGPAETLFSRPRHPYTAALLASAPVPDPERRRGRRKVSLAGEVPDPAHVPAGCPFHPRCAFAVERCRTEVPALRPMGGTAVACHRAEELDLTLDVAPGLHAAHGVGDAA